MEFALKYENNVNEPTMMERDNGLYTQVRHIDSFSWLVGALLETS
jgi:hypothetical protein